MICGFWIVEAEFHSMSNTGSWGLAVSLARWLFYFVLDPTVFEAGRRSFVARALARLIHYHNSTIRFPEVPAFKGLKGSLLAELAEQALYLAPLIQRDTTASKAIGRGTCIKTISSLNPSHGPLQMNMF
jgi:hypothetical protein